MTDAVTALIRSNKRGARLDATIADWLPRVFAVAAHDLRSKGPDPLLRNRVRFSRPTTVAESNSLAIRHALDHDATFTVVVEAGGVYDQGALNLAVDKIRSTPQLAAVILDSDVTLWLASALALFDGSADLEAAAINSGWLVAIAEPRRLPAWRLERKLKRRVKREAARPVESQISEIVHVRRSSR